MPTNKNWIESGHEDAASQEAAKATDVKAWRKCGGSEKAAATIQALQGLITRFQKIQ